MGDSSSKLEKHTFEQVLYDIFPIGNITPDMLVSSPIVHYRSLFRESCTIVDLIVHYRPFSAESMHYRRFGN